ncbi:Hypothetical predicted protein [Mytilus galloprovincialis]|uniref:Uncharacterized protein n=1 Tax=Mytilus galloprovincialis TaxID=29158 RepID=A0A8B6EXG0_MYTGA|nr:Hypothetical predicted protein [Mytilus galloprovincialis]
MANICLWIRKTNLRGSTFEPVSVRISQLAVTEHKIDSVLSSVKCLIQWYICSDGVAMVKSLSLNVDRENNSASYSFTSSCKGYVLSANDFNKHLRLALTYPTKNTCLNGLNYIDN